MAHNISFEAKLHLESVFVLRVWYASVRFPSTWSNVKKQNWIMLTESRIIPRMRHLFFPTLVHTVHTPLLKPSWKHYYNNGDIIHHHQGSIQAICPLLRLQLISTTLVFCLLSLSLPHPLSLSLPPPSLSSLSPIHQSFHLSVYV